MKKIIVRESLVFLGSLFVGLGVFGPLIAIVCGSHPVEFYLCLFGPYFDPLTWAVGLGTYVLVQLYRATVRATKTVRAR